MLAVRKRVLVTVKTYPNPSTKYKETVCTAGIDLDTGRFVRLYPVRFRHLSYASQFKKWDILEFDAFHKSSDVRGDTWTPQGDFVTMGHIDTGPGRPPNWAKRNAVILPLTSTIEDLEIRARDRSCSLGVVKVHAPARLRVVSSPGEWTQKQSLAIAQEGLFDEKCRPLERVPVKFMYEFRCHGSCKGHRVQLFDWEVYALYRRQLDKRGDAVAAAQDVEQHFNVQLGTETHDLHLFVGTHFEHQDQFSAIGVYYPPLRTQ
ncbi:MAG: hypothetical protein Q7J82_01015 [Coriobacteriia bacterium]|nr:hypothetical protein [Coriobacteriia bacterium]